MLKTANDFQKTALNEVISINHIYSFHYIEHPKEFVFDGEKHNFWELLFVDKGEVEVMADDKGYKLKQGDIIFHKPNEFHRVWANKKIAPNIIVISFDCKSSSIKFFENKLLHLDNEDSNIFAKVIGEGLKSFAGHTYHPFKVIKSPDAPFGSEQLFKLYLEILLISLISKENGDTKEKRIYSVMKDRTEYAAAEKIIQFMKQNITQNLTFKDICRYSLLSETHLKVMFKEKTGIGVMEYYKKLKIDQAKTIMREGACNITTIAEDLGFSSIHHFSRFFKTITGLSSCRLSGRSK